MDMLPNSFDWIQWLVKKIEQFPQRKTHEIRQKGPCLKDLDEINIPQAILWLLSYIFVRHTDAVRLQNMSFVPVSLLLCVGGPEQVNTY